jgi:hypothetical protein
LIPSAGIVNECETAAGSRAVTVLGAPAALFGDAALIGVIVIVPPSVPATFAYTSDPFGRAVASSKFVTVTTTVALAGRVKSDGMNAGNSV